MHIDRTAPSFADSCPVIAAGHRIPVLEALVHGLEIEFGAGVSRGLAQRFIAAEECDFMWQARLSERWLGRYESAFDEDEEAIDLDRIAVLGSTGEAGGDEAWYVATFIVDGEGDPHGTIAHRAYADRIEAEQAWVQIG